MDDMAGYDPRYLAGILLFNRGDFFEAHEVWEDLWTDCAGLDRSFYQGLIQAAVALCHFCNGNLRGAVKLYHSSHQYMSKYAAHHLGLDNTQFWQQMERCFAELLAHPDGSHRVEPDEALIPEVHLTPAPLHWPDPAEYVPREEGTS
jgi:predicted metal-dependent hydrolase